MGGDVFVVGFVFGVDGLCDGVIELLDVFLIEVYVFE